MPEQSADAITKTHFCRQPGCTNEARSDRGLYSRCDEHRGTTTAAPRPSTGGGVGSDDSLVSQLAAVRALAQTADRLKARAAKLTTEALVAKREADRAAATFRDAARKILAPGSAAYEDE